MLTSEINAAILEDVIARTRVIVDGQGIVPSELPSTLQWL
jgi:hypothetical protein